MKKVVFAAVLVGLCLGMLSASEAQAQAAQPQPPGGMLPRVGGPIVEPKRGAVVLSWVLPGTGEWLNNGFAGQFPVLECVGGSVCCLIRFSSTLDAAAGDRSDKIRIDFWSKPVPEG